MTQIRMCKSPRDEQALPRLEGISIEHLRDIIEKEQRSEISSFRVGAPGRQSNPLDNQSRDRFINTASPLLPFSPKTKGLLDKTKDGRLINNKEEDFALLVGLGLSNEITVILRDIITSRWIARSIYIYTGCPKRLGLRLRVTEVKWMKKVRINRKCFIGKI